MEHQAPVQTIAFSPIGNALLTVSADGKARVWEARLGRPSVVDFKGAHPGVNVSTSPTGLAGYWLSGAGSRVQFIDPSCNRSVGAPLRHEGDGPLDCLAISPDGKSALTLTSRTTVQLRDVATGRALGKPIPHRCPVKAVAFSATGKPIATASGDADHGEARVWDTETGQPHSGPFPHPGSILSLCFRPDGGALLTGCWDKKARLWDVGDGTLLRELDHDNAVSRVEFARDGQTFLTVTHDGPAHLWSNEGRLIATVPGGNIKLDAVAYSPDGRLVATAHSRQGEYAGEVRVWKAATGEPIVAPILQPGPVTTVAISSDSGLLLTGSDQLPARLWNIQTARPMGPPLIHPVNVRVTRVAAFDRGCHGTWNVGETGTDAVYWALPEPLQGTPELLRLWTEVVSGLEMDGAGGTRRLSPGEWLERRQQLNRLAAPPVTEPTMVAPLRERRKEPTPSGLSAVGG
jgi:WD40 repeat protein